MGLSSSAGPQQGYQQPNNGFANPGSQGGFNSYMPHFHQRGLTPFTPPQNGHILDSNSFGQQSTPTNQSPFTPFTPPAEGHILDSQQSAPFSQPPQSQTPDSPPSNFTPFTPPPEAHILDGGQQPFQQQPQMQQPFQQPQLQLPPNAMSYPAPQQGFTALNPGMNGFDLNSGSLFSNLRF